MASNEVKRQHYVPRTYLKNFSFQKGEEFYIKALPVDNPKAEKIFDLNTKNVCLEKNIYTLLGDTAEKRMLIEKFYSDEIEKYYTEIYQMLIDPAKTAINERERDLIMTTVVTMFYRTTKWVHRHNDLMKRVYARMFELCNQTGKDYFTMHDQKISIKGKNLEEFIKGSPVENQPMMALTQLEVAMKLIQARNERDGIYVSKLSDADCEFITSDNPVAVQNVRGEHSMPFDPSNILKLPLDKKHMLFLMPYADEESKHKIARHNVSGLYCKTEMLVSNTEQFRKAERFILGDDASLNSYLKTKEVAERPLTAEENAAIKTHGDLIQKGKELGLF